MQILWVDNFQLRNHGVANAVACDLLIVISVILNKYNIVIFSILTDFNSGEGQHWADDFAVHGWDAAQAFESGAPAKVEKLCFRCVGGVVRGDKKVEIGHKF